MSQEYAGQDPIKIAQQAEADLGSTAALQGHDASVSARHGKGASDSTTESGVDESVRQKFPGSDVIYGSGASGAGGNREIPVSEGGEINPATGQPTKARDFEGTGGLADKAQELEETNPGSDEVQSNVRQGGGQT